MRTVILSMFLVFCLNGVNAQEILRIDFAGEEGYGWQNGVMNLRNENWSLDGSGFLSATGAACVNSSGFFSVTGCRGAFVFRTRKIPVKTLPGVQVRVRIGEELPEQQLKFEVVNVPDNRIHFTTEYPSGPVVTMMAAVVKDSAFAEIRVSRLSELSRFSFGDFVMEVLEEGKADIVCTADQDTLLLCAASSSLRIPFKIRNHDKSEQLLAIRQIEFQADTNLSDFVTGAKLSGEDGRVIYEGELSDRLIRFYQTSGLYRIPYTDSLELVLELTPYRHLVRDRQLLNLSFSEKSFGYSTGSCKISEAEKCLIPPLRNEVVATEKCILGYPYTWQKEVALTVGGRDEYGNVDRSAETAYRLVVSDENGNQVMADDRLLKSPDTLRIGLPDRGHYYLSLNDEDRVYISGAVEQTVYEEHFDVMPSGWIGAGSWKTEEGRLQHALDNVSGASWFMHAVECVDYEHKNLVWSASVGNRDWISSSLNYFRYYLLSDTTDAVYRKALYFTVDAVSKEELLIVEANGKKDTIWQGGRPWLANEAYTTEIVYRPSGEWEIRLGMKDDEVWRVGQAVKLLPANFFNRRMYSGILFKHTSAARGGKLWVDDLGLRCFDAKGEFARYEVVADREIRLSYTGAMDRQMLADAGNYELLFNGSACLLDSVRVVGNSSVSLFAGLMSGDYVLNVKAMRDNTMGMASSETIRFSHVRAAVKGDVTVNEIMFKPKAGLGLPVQEYVELYNLRDEAVRLDSLQFTDRGKVRDYLTDTLPGLSYLLLGGTGVTELSGYGPVCKVKGFALVDDSAALVLITKAGEMMDSVYYKSYWIRDKEKKDGGYSLEKNRPERNSGDGQNWNVSLAPEGGTPGKKNTEYPTSGFVRYEVLADRGIRLYYLSPMDGRQLCDMHNYELLFQGNPIVVDSVRGEGDRSVILYAGLQTGDYVLNVKELQDWMYEIIPPVSLSFFHVRAVRRGEVVFNEVMFKLGKEMTLPAQKYVELYNLRDEDLLLDSIVLKDRGKVKGYINDTIRANGYLIVGGTGIAELAGYGRVSRVTGFSLLNDSAGLSMTRRSGELLDSIRYDLSWIRDKQKKNGGYSLEKIIPEKPSPDLTNWYESVATEGGTPGRQNSVYRNCPDKTAPYLLSCKPGKGTVVLLFSEPVYEPTAMNRQNYRLSDGYDFPDRIVRKENQVTLFYNREFRGDWDYTLQVTGVADYSGHRLRDTAVLFFVAPEVESEDVIFSELMYDAVTTKAKYIELYNRSGKRIDLSGLRLAKWDDRHQISSLRAIVDTCLIFKPGTLVWICADPAAVMESYKYHNPDNYVIPGSMLTFDQKGGTLFVVTGDTTVIDQLEYGNFLHSLSVKVTKGVSVERIDYESGMNVPVAWTSANGDAGSGYGSPGMPNRGVRGGTMRSAGRVFERIPEVFTPDGDGLEDVVEMIVTDEGKDFTLKLLICDASGRLVKSIADGVPVSSQSVFTWDGTGADQSLVPAGVYAIICRIVYADGRSRTFKEACVVSR